MKKNLAALGLAALMLAACSSNGGTTTDDTASEGAKTYEATVEDASNQDEVTATLTKEDGKLTGISIDELQPESEKTKKELKEDYGMRDASPIGKEWYEQIDALEQFILANGVDAVELDADGKATNEDLKSSCTINIATIMDAVKKADEKSE